MNEKKEEIKKKIENEKKLQEAIKKAKEKGIQTAQITNTIPLIEQLNYKNMNLLYNGHKINFIYYLTHLFRKNGLTFG